MPKHTQKKKKIIRIKPLFDRVLIQEEINAGEVERASGIYIPETVADEKGAKRGTVVAVGEGRVDENGTRIPLSVRMGDTVLFQWGDTVKIDDTEYYIVNESSILGIIS